MYDERFFDMIREGCQRSARAVVPRFLDRYRPATVVDVGGGEGWWGVEFEAHGCAVTGVDGPDTRSRLQTFHGRDLAEPFAAHLGGPFDLAVCLEVAEHLPASRADSFVAELCALAPVVLFSAAIPRQGGVGHLNEQWPAYWSERFAACGYRTTGSFRYELWNDPAIENWYRQNILVAVAPGWAMLEADGLLSLFAPGWEPLPLVHPVLWASRTGSDLP